MSQIIQKLNEIYKNFTYPILGINIRFNFSFEEMVNALQRWGYKLVIHSALVDIETSHYDGMECSHITVTKDSLREGVAAIREGERLPERWDDDYGKAHLVIPTFQREIKNKLLS